MKKKAYMAPEIEVHTISVQQMICGSSDPTITGVDGDTGVGVSEEDTEPSGGGDARSIGCWDDEEVW